MKILVTGRGTSGSWQIRGVQLGQAIHADVNVKPASIEHDVVVVVKRWTLDLLNKIRASGALFVYDIVDAWPQPEGNAWARDECLRWLRVHLDAARPHAVVAATQQMATDCEECGHRAFWLPHHGRPYQSVNRIRHEVTCVGYEGGAHYLGGWLTTIEHECRQRGWQFVLNPRSLSELDVVFAFRDFNGYAARNWKSNVKLANAQVTGTPAVLTPEAGYIETSSKYEFFVDTPAEFSEALDILEYYSVRSTAAKRMLEVAPRLHQVAETYRAWLSELK